MNKRTATDSLILLPSRALVDACVEMVETQVLIMLTWIKPEECTSRAQEIQSVKKDPRLTLDSDGSLKTSSKTPTATCQLSTEFDLRDAFQRRSLALDQARLCAPRVTEKRTQRPAQPAGTVSATLAQLIKCDKQLLWKRPMSWWLVWLLSRLNRDLLMQELKGCRPRPSWITSWGHCPPRQTTV